LIDASETCGSDHVWDWFNFNLLNPRSDIEYWQGPVVAALTCRRCETRGLIWTQAWGGYKLAKRVYWLTPCSGLVFDHYLKNQANGSCQVSRAHDELVALFQLRSERSAFYLVDLSAQTACEVAPQQEASPSFDLWQKGFARQSEWQALIDRKS
jgi:hypothetical protein